MDGSRKPGMSRVPIARVADLDGVFMRDEQRAATWRQFFAHAAELAERLPRSRHVVNLCESRYGFTVAFVAALMAQRITILPASAAGLEEWVDTYPGAGVLVDAGKPLGSPAPAAPALEVPGIGYAAALPAGSPAARVRSRAARVEIPSIDVEQAACVVFSSGSTGSATSHVKRWGVLSRAALDIGARFGFAVGRQTVVGTVPSRHMFGLETTVLLPLQWGSTVYAGRPLLPGDIEMATRVLEGERWLMTTPIQLRALVDDSLCQARFEAVISATMPLSAALAGQVEQRYGATVYEIYGCTEAGSVASRRTTASSDWDTLREITIHEGAGSAWVQGGHIAEPTALADIVSIVDERRFSLRGLAAHLVKVGGKRASLEALNALLTQIPGVRDGCFYVPDEPGDDGGTRLVAFAVAPGLTAPGLIAELRERLDPVFVPRPLYLVSELPRNDLGKLTRRDLALMAEQLGGAARTTGADRDPAGHAGASQAVRG